MTNILLYTTSFYPSVGGTERATYLLAQQLVHHDYIVTVVTRTPDPDNDFPSGKDGINVVRNPGLRRLGKMCNISDLIIINGGFSVRAWLGIRQTQTPYILIHAMITSGLREGGNPVHLIGNAIRKRMKKNAYIHVGVSTEVLKSAGVEGQVIPNMIEPALFDHARLKRSAVKEYDLVFVGRLIASKGLQDILEALAQLKKKKINVTLVVVGSGAYEKNARELALDLGLKDQVDFKGFLDAEDLAEMYVSSKVLVHTPNAPEGFGMGLIEAMAFGLPLIVNDKPALPETAGDAGIIVPQGDIRQLASAIEHVVCDDEVYNEFAEKALKRAELFRAESVFEQWKKILESI